MVLGLDREVGHHCSALPPETPLTPSWKRTSPRPFISLEAPPRPANTKTASSCAALVPFVFHFLSFRVSLPLLSCSTQATSICCFRDDAWRISGLDSALRVGVFERVSPRTGRMKWPGDRHRQHHSHNLRADVVELHLPP